MHKVRFKAFTGVWVSFNGEEIKIVSHVCFFKIIIIIPKHLFT